MQAPSLSLPVVGMYLPALQFWQVPASIAARVAENLPVEHNTQLVMALLPCNSRNVPAMQSLQTDAPSDAEYLPFSHDTQAPSSSLAVVGALLPALHL